MKLSYYCDSCKQENYFKTNATNRGDLQMELGKDEINERCKYCGKFTKKHINRLMAVPNKKIILFGGLIGIIFAFILFFIFGWISALAFSIPILITAQQRKIASSFNQTMIRRK